MLMSQRKAIAALRAATGLSIEACSRAVKNMPKKQDGAYFKVHRLDVRNAILDLSAPPVAKEVDMRPLSEKQIARARRARAAQQDWPAVIQ